MVESEKIYQSILLRLSSIPVDYLEQVDNYLQRFSQNIEKKKQNQVEIMSLAGSWSDMSDEDFGEFLEVAKSTGKELFIEDIEL
ncbi:hypothetical protein [Haliscomenobacter hydrossis]|uniref:DUF2281 domain-containing protein n=1 Tax=Haliscomenobacter hydrossis (strain ATCC 27775 / DSM 1100 / LMG 10767 / O) TaxID=760192 RepID=F4KVC2_HALH1|nr:hypothetical protein [Haliscomenobacter hydrossis]AEE50248.1 hypothetical protein Halhy_2372 [Haliscomenobacter hydrossis DSM 1100]